ncbi:D-beta-D-heptose 1-phosphate adenylyltransferase [archaeon HR01]|nr:D-beta-D-heptose 1-phosphate adenylyltransferase [archaeon HR01]
MGRRIVVTTGAFDILHLGHMKMLAAAKRLAGPKGKLVVVVATDKTVLAKKHRPPIFKAKQRAEMLKFLRPVDEAVVGYDPVSFEKVLKRFKPQIVAFGYDQKEIKKKFVEFCRENKIRVKVVSLPKYDAGGLDSSSSVIRRVKGVVSR